jgi:2-methylcitrate dehydratase PrpD
MTRLSRLAEWAAKVCDEDIPDRVRSLAASQVLSQLAAIRAGWGHPLGKRVADTFGSPTHPDPRTAAPVLAGLGLWLNLDDTAYAGHLSASTVSVPVAFARARGLGGAELLTAVVVANECAARITASATLGPLRGQSALHTHLAGTVAGRLRCEPASVAQWTDAFGLALATPPWPLLRAFLASDARVLSAMTPVRTALDACDAALAGLHGAADLMEHPDGFLARFATVGLPEAIDHRLGERWHTETLSFKVRPGGPGIDAAVDCAVELGPIRPEDIEEVLVEGSIYTLMVDRTAHRYLDGAASPLGALVLNVAYPVATALLTGQLTHADLEPPATACQDRWAVAGKVRLAHDPAMTRELLGSAAPFGEALRMAGDRAADWLSGFGPELTVGDAPADDDFTQARKATPARITVRLTDGRVISQERAVPLGAAGPDTRLRHAELVRDKFVGLGGAPDVADAARDLDRMTPTELDEWLVAALR